MQNAMQSEFIKPTPAIPPGDLPAMSDDECLARLADAIEAHDFDRMDEVARLIARLTATIE